MLYIRRMYGMKNAFPPLLLLVLVSLASCAQNSGKQSHAAPADKQLKFDGKTIDKPDEEWQAELEPFQYRVMRHQATERAFSGEYDHFYEKGTYYCAGCGLALFSSDTKFDSGSGWPSFYQPIFPENVGENTDYEIGYARTEVHCARCGGHLGHVFDDAFGQPTGLRYCINSVSLHFEPEK